MDRIKEDDRFSRILKDPRFLKVPKAERKVKIDKRFESMFNDKRFKLKYTVDKRGRPVNHTSNEDLKKYYELSSSEGTSSEDDDDDIIDNDVSKNKQLAKLANKIVDVDLTKKDNQSRNMNNKQQKEKIERLVENNNSVRKTNKTMKEEPQKIKGKTTLKQRKSRSTEKLKFSDSEDHVSSDEEAVSSNIAKAGSSKSGITLEKDYSKTGESESSSDSSEEEIDLARGEGNVETTDSESSWSSEDEDTSHPWGELDNNAPEASEITSRLAACNMDWDRIKAEDLFVLFTSFKPASGIVHSVKIYKSEFGKQRLAEEELQGPKELVEETINDDDGDDDDEKTEDPEGAKYHMEKLRKYQLNRLRYFYAIIECDSPETANKLYEECDGLEYETSSTRMDLRFIPDDMTFDEEPVAVAENLPDPSKYKPSLFTTTALQQAKVKLTWDETNPDRIHTIQQAFNNDDIEKMDLKAYLASSSSDEEPDASDIEELNASNDENEENQIAKYKALLQSIEDEDKKKKEKDVELEISWEPGLKETTENILKKVQENKAQITPWEQYLQKKKEKKKQKRLERQMKQKQEDETTEQGTNAEDKLFSDDEIPSDVDLNDPYFKDETESSRSTKSEKKSKKTKNKEDDSSHLKEQELELLLMDNDDGRQHFNLPSLMKQQNQKKKKKKENKAVAVEEDTFEVNLSDPRFSALYNSHLYNVDPSDPLFKKTKGMDAIIQEKQRRRLANTDDIESKTKKPKIEESSLQAKPKDLELSTLVKSVKSKSKYFQANKKR